MVPPLIPYILIYANYAVWVYCIDHLANITMCLDGCGVFFFLTNIGLDLDLLLLLLAALLLRNLMSGGGNLSVQPEL